MKRYVFFAFAALLMVTSCKNDLPPDEALSSQDKLLIATLYQQKSAERDAICLQAYNIARMQLDEILARPDSIKNPAIVLDLDETVLDNSQYEAKCIIDDITYPKGWDEWMHAAAAKAIPGAVDFLKYAADRGVDIFYITNRKEKYRQATLQNLQDLDIEPKDEAHLLLRTDTSSKEARRQEVLKNHRIIMLFGDNLADFSDAFDGKKTPEQRAKLVQDLQETFGNRFIVFPNAMYGEWLNAIIDYRFELTPAEKTKLEKQALTDF